jgi:hypothetical protein
MSAEFPAMRHILHLLTCFNGVLGRLAISLYISFFILLIAHTLHIISELFLIFDCHYYPLITIAYDCAVA